MHNKYVWLMCLIIGLSGLIVVKYGMAKMTSERSIKAFEQNAPALKEQLQAKNLEFGAPIFIRIFKSESILELWIENKQGKFELFKHYPICKFSGKLGPKLKEGDRQSPEGFYFVKPNQLNPNSRFHLSFNIGFPNAYDRFHQRTGSALMVHGNCVSIGCYAMGDDAIEEIYTLITAAFENKQPFFRIHIFPFYMDATNMNQYKNNNWYDFWLNLKQGYDAFENNHQVPNVEVKNGQYIFE
ncbi:L,D-transpeptidase family protein [Marinicellulosiphila megalodicopiae]|uniref:L,D-transpeptidase family protein n=1 Tax=Marinicellulosiphila megalodicopiae TaxID=2724896 RepID=UPI003BAF3C8B